MVMLMCFINMGALMSGRDTPTPGVSESRGAPRWYRSDKVVAVAGKVKPLGLCSLAPLS